MKTGEKKQKYCKQSILMSVKSSIHIVAFDVPMPPDYGGVIDIYYRCRTLKNAGYHVILHCFEYGRGRTQDASEIADEIHYYDRNSFVWSWFSRKPFIVKTRNNNELLSRLLEDDAPVLIEGQHCTFFLDHPQLQSRKKLVRLHNIEWQYYAELSKRSTSFFKKLFFWTESRKLKRNESQLKYASVLACISHSDTAYYQSLFSEVVYLPVGLNLFPTHVEPLQRAHFLLFHGNLSIAENQEAVSWILDVLSHHTLDLEIVIAGKSPSRALMQRCNGTTNLQLIADPNDLMMQQLMQSATAHLLIGFQHSGIKLKLLNALLTGKRCIATPAMVAGSGLEIFCEIIETPLELIHKINHFEPISEEKTHERLSQLRMLFSDEQLLDVVKKHLY